MQDQAPTPNGHEPDSFEAKLLVDLDGAIREKRAKLDRLEDDRTKLAQTIIDERAALRRWESVKRQMLGEPAPGRPRGPQRAAKSYPKTVSPDRLAGVEADIRRYVEENGDEFRQIDIRSMPDAAVSGSGAIAVAFEKLVQASVIRLARVSNDKPPGERGKFYRLTRSAVRA
jgi:hypothetical protein